MVTYLPISSPFIRFASRYMDDAMGVAAGKKNIFTQIEDLQANAHLKATTFSYSKPCL